MKNYEKIVEKLYQIRTKSFSKKYTVDNMKIFLQKFNWPNNNFSSIHIAGTNGKGSVATKIANVLSLNGYKTGLFVSPHIQSVRERISIDCKLISRADFCIFLDRIFDYTKTMDLSFFEIITGLALCYFSQKGVQYAVMEVGMGGRLDATNVINPILSIITSISLDHTSILGYTINEITREKAGIIKKNIPVIIGPHVQKNIIKEVSGCNSPIISVEGVFDDFDEENTAIAQMALLELKKQIQIKNMKKGLSKRPSCRFEVIKKDVVLDVAHNPDGFERLFRTVNVKYPGRSIRVVLAFSKGKDVLQCLSITAKYTKDVHIVENSHERIIPARTLIPILNKVGLNSIDDSYEIDHVVPFALHLAKLHHQIFLCCGSFFIMEDIKRLFKELF